MIKRKNYKSKEDKQILKPVWEDFWSMFYLELCSHIISNVKIIADKSSQID